MRAYTLPCAMPATSSVTKRFQFIRDGARPSGPRPYSRRLRDRLVLAVDDLEDVEFRTRDIAVGGQLQRSAEDGRGKRYLEDVLAYLGPADLAVLARRGHRARVHLGKHVVRSPERARRPGELLVERLDDRAVGRDRGDVRREERDVGALLCELRRVEGAVASERDRRLALRLQLLREELSLGGDLERQEDDLRAGVDLRDQRGEVGRLLADRLTIHVDTLRLERVLDDVGEARRIRLLVVDDHDLRARRHAELLLHVRRVGRALHAVVRDVAEEVALPRAVRERDAS